MKITIVGWYGTETIGDRAILAGLISFFHKSFDDFEVKLGSLHPFFSERTIDEDQGFYHQITKKNINVSIFDSKDSKALSKAIKASDLVIMGGGPLMDLNELFMVEYAFKKAKKLKKKTALLGCGVGPLFHKKYRKSVFEIARYSDKIILRDNASKARLNDIYSEFGESLSANDVLVSLDPAVECTMRFTSFNDVQQEGYIAVNLREFPVEYSEKKNSEQINTGLKNFIKSLAEHFSNQEVRLIPMHYFHIGNDDRVFLNSIAQSLNVENVSVQNSTLSLEETIRVYQGASFNIGMRFHSVVLQTICSGKNYILDYTEPKKGKISGFLQDIDYENSFYKSRYISLQNDAITVDTITNVDDKFHFNEQSVSLKLEVYIDTLKALQL